MNRHCSFPGNRAEVTALVDGVRELWGDRRMLIVWEVICSLSIELSVGYNIRLSRRKERQECPLPNASSRMRGRIEPGTIEWEGGES